MPDTIEVLETPAEFAARHWGGSYPERIPAGFGPRDVDGGRVRYPAGWKFYADGFSYRVYRQPKSDHWTVGISDGGFATFHRDGDHWVVTTGWGGETRRIPVQTATPTTV